MTLALSFGLLIWVGRYFLKKNKTTPGSTLLGAVGVLATLSTLLSVLLLGDYPLALKLSTVVLLGFSEALLMFLWLQYYTMVAAGHLFRSFAVDMIFGGVIAFFTCCLQPPIGQIVAVCLPPVATVSLIINWRTVEPKAVPPAVVPVRPPMKGILRHSLKTLLPTTVYAFVFGLLQGAFLTSGVALLMAGNPVVLIGIVLAGSIIFFIREAPETNADIDTMHRFSLLLFVLGIVGLSFLPAGGAVLLLSEIAILAGFNLFDFGGLILGVGLARRLKPDSLLLVDGGRVLVYASLALGLMVGDLGMIAIGGEQDEFVLLAICGIAIAMLIVTVLTPFRDQVPIEAQIMAGLAQGNAAVEAAGAGGAPAPAAAETVPPATAAPQANGSAAAAEAAAAPVPSKSAKGEAAAVERPAQESASKKRAAAAVQARPDTPWRRTCQQIAELYKLSPRETEIFFLIAKGRNAEYIQQKLVISTHTAKTHIANIYHKLGVHSSQEMLSLIETFREQDIKSREQGGD